MESSYFLDPHFHGLYAKHVDYFSIDWSMNPSPKKVDVFKGKFLSNHPQDDGFWGNKNNVGAGSRTIGPQDDGLWRNENNAGSGSRTIGPGLRIYSRRWEGVRVLSYDPLRCNILADDYVQQIRSGNGHMQSAIMQTDGHTRSSIMQNNYDQESEKLTRYGTVANDGAYATFYDTLDFGQGNGEFWDDMNGGADSSSNRFSRFKIPLYPNDMWIDGTDYNTNAWRNAYADYGNAGSSHQQNGNVDSHLDRGSERFDHMGWNSIYDQYGHRIQGTLGDHTRSCNYQNGYAESSLSYLDNQGFNCSGWNSTYARSFWKCRQVTDDGNARNSVGQNLGRGKIHAVKQSVIDDGFEQQHHPAMEFALEKLCAKDLLHVEAACKSLRVAVREDPFLWSHIRVESPPYRKFMNNDLMKLSKRAQGNLECLVLIDCQDITDYALWEIVLNNPHLKKMSLPGCLRVTAPGILHIITVAKVVNNMLNLRFLGASGVTGVLLDEKDNFRSLMLSNIDNPHNVANGTVEIDICTDCNGVTVIYDTLGSKCHGDGTDANDFKYCFCCMPRCNKCLKHIRDGKFMKDFTFDRKYTSDLSFDVICLDCSHKIFWPPSYYHPQTYKKT